jgi:hypothetical protein
MPQKDPFLQSRSFIHGMNSPPLGVHVLFTFILHACECCMLQYQPPLAVWATSRPK